MNELPLSANHLKMLRDESGITEEIIKQRGYRTVFDKKDLAKFGFAKNQQLVPGLLIPVYAPDGSNGLYQLRPDAPRVKKEKSGKLKPIKYETPRNAKMRVDCPAVCREQIKDPSIRLWITEGVKKGDALASRGLCAIALLGVWNFKGKNEFGGVTFSADFNEIALNERDVCIVFDSDIMHKPEVRKAMETLKEHLERRGAKVSIVYLEHSGDGKTGVDDYLLKHSVEELEALIEKPRPEASPATAVFELLDAPPSEMRRPLQIIDGRAYAATQLYIKKTVSESRDNNGNIVRHNPPLETVNQEIFVLRDDGTLFGPGQKHSLEDLGFQVNLPEMPPQKYLLKTESVKAFQNKKLPNPLEVFDALKTSYNHFLDFNRSLADQQTMCELSACFALMTWFVEILSVVGYLYATGGKGSGKTKHLQLTCELAYLGQFIQASGSLAALRDMADFGAFLGFDDAEQISSPQYDPDKRNLLLAGNRRGSQIPVKEPIPNERAWRTRYVNTFCPRGFSAIRLPDDVLSDRSITFPLIRTANKEKANSDVSDEMCWQTNPNVLRQDLWLLALANLTKVKAFDREAASKATLHGRLLDTWRGSLAVALWLDSLDKNGTLKRENENTGELETLFERLNRLSVGYQKQRTDLEKVDFTRIALRAVMRCILGNVGEPYDLTELRSLGTKQWNLLTKDIADKAKKIVDDEEIEVNFTAKDEAEFEAKLTRLIGRERTKLLFEKSREGGTGKMRWLIKLDDLETSLAAFNLSKSEVVSENALPTCNTSHYSHTSHTSQGLTEKREDCEQREDCEVLPESKTEEKKTFLCPHCSTVCDWETEVCPGCGKNPQPQF